jgi:catechol 2,3-dioxygenase-like lactoylglutathione lyase family enzyme
MRHWLARGVGPFFVEELRGYPAVVRGETVSVDLTAAFSYSGDQQIEVIQPLGGAQTIYDEFLAGNAEGGLQHVAFWVDDIEEKLAELESAGHRYKVVQRYGDRHAYLDNLEMPGVMIQLMAHNESIDELFSLIRDAAELWDGFSHPIRKIDWSAGRPVVREEAASS